MPQHNLLFLACKYVPILQKEKALEKITITSTGITHSFIYNQFKSKTKSRKIKRTTYVSIFCIVLEKKKGKKNQLEIVMVPTTITLDFYNQFA